MLIWEHFFFSGADIPIEERPAAELFSGLEGVEVWNPAFDVTPAELITGINSRETTID